jgi:geranylgeranyl reductase family protein
MTTTIIGAGPTGCYTAFKLAKKGIPTNVIEEHGAVGLPLQCTGLVSENLKQVIDFPDKIVVNRINRAKFFFPKAEPVTFKGRAYVLDRVAFDQHLYEKALLAGVKFYFNERYNTFREGHLLQVNTSKRSIESKMLVGADGPFSAVAKQIGVTNNVLYGMQVRARGNFEADTAELHFGSEYPGFFAWLVPENAEVARIGLAAKENLADKLKSFLRNNGILKFIDQQGGAIPLDFHDEFVWDRVALVGDAASQTKATTGGGLTTGMESAKILVRAIDQCYKSEDFSKEFLHENYVAAWKKGIGKELKKAYYMRKTFDLFSDEDFLEFGKVVGSKDFKETLEANVDMEMYSKFIGKAVLHPKVMMFMVKMGIKHPGIIKNVFSALL